VIHLLLDLMGQSYFIFLQQFVFMLFELYIRLIEDHEYCVYKDLYLNLLVHSSFISLFYESIVKVL